MPNTERAGSKWCLFMPSAATLGVQAEVTQADWDPGGLQDRDGYYPSSPDYKCLKTRSTYFIHELRFSKVITRLGH